MESQAASQPPELQALQALPVLQALQVSPELQALQVLQVSPELQVLRQRVVLARAVVEHDRLGDVQASRVHEKRAGVWPVESLRVAAWCR